MDDKRLASEFWLKGRPSQAVSILSSQHSSSESWACSLFKRRLNTQKGHSLSQLCYSPSQTHSFSHLFFNPDSSSWLFLDQVNFWHLTISIICKRTDILSDAVMGFYDFMSLGIYYKYRFNTLLQEVGNLPWHRFFFLTLLSLVCWSKYRPNTVAS